MPNASDLNASRCWMIANAVAAGLSSDGRVLVNREKSTANFIVDVNGYFG